MSEYRRRFLKVSTAALILPFIGSGLLIPTRVLAAEWNTAGFTSRSLADAIKASAHGNAIESRDIRITAPEIAENGAKVEVDISSNLPGTRSLAIFSEKNPMPLAATIEFSGEALPFTRIQLKLSETMRVRVIAKTADGKSHVAFREIKVTQGGCGG